VLEDVAIVSFASESVVNDVAMEYDVSDVKSTLAGPQVSDILPSAAWKKINNIGHDEWKRR